MSLILEVGITVLSLNRNPLRFPLRQPSDYDEVARFLRDGIGPNRQIVGRRDLVVRSWSERDIRRITRLLNDLGVLENRGRGNGLQLSSET